MVDWEVFLQEGGACSADVAAGRTASITSGDLSDLVFTSGTTGQPKGAMTTHGQTLRTFATWSEVVGLRQGDRYLIVNPFFHTFGYKAGILACLMTGATMVPEPVFDVDLVMSRIDDERISVLPGPPTIFQSILDHPDRKGFDLSSLRLVVTGAAVVPVELVEGLWSDLGHRDRAHRLRADRGHRDGDHVPAGRLGRGHLGHVGPGHPRRRRADRRTATAPRWPGARPARSSSAATTSCAATSTTPRPPTRPSTSTAGCTPGDVGVMDAAGNVTITDRLKDMYVSGGFNVYPAEVEAVLRLHPAVGQVAVVGVPDRRLGEVGLAVVVPAAAGADPADLADGLLALGPRADGQLQGAPAGGDRRRRCRSTPAARCSSASCGSGTHHRFDRAVPDRRPAGPVHRPEHSSGNVRISSEEREGCHARHRVHR